MVKLDRQLSDSFPNKDQDTEVWITVIEYFRVRLDDIGSNFLEKEFMIHVLNNLPTDYYLQIALLEKRIGDKVKQITVEEMRAELSLNFERLNMTYKKD
jgi:hypothetical protein